MQALEAAREPKTISQISAEQGVHPNQVGTWKKQLLQEGATVFTNQSAQKEREQATKEADLYEQLG